MLTHPFAGIHPTKYCLARLKSAPAELEHLLRCTFAPQGLRDAAVVDYPKHVEALTQSVAEAAAWELSRYGCLLIQDVVDWSKREEPRAHAANA